MICGLQSSRQLLLLCRAQRGDEVRIDMLSLEHSIL